MGQISDYSAVYRAFIEYKNQDVIILAHCDKTSYYQYLQAKFFYGDLIGQDIDIIYLPQYDQQYDIVSPSDDIVQERSWALSQLASTKKKKILITSIESLLQKFPSRKHYQHYLKIDVGDVVNINEFAQLLTHNGFLRMGTAFSSGEFAVRGDIIDIVLPGLKGYRIVIAWDKVEQIKEFDLNTQISLSQLGSLTIYKIHEVSLSEVNIGIFKQNFLEEFGIKHTDNKIYKKTLSLQKADRIEEFSILFFNEDPVNICEYFDSSVIFAFNDYKNLLQLSLQGFVVEYNTVLSRNDIALPPQRKFFDIDQVEHILSRQQLVPESNIIQLIPNLHYKALQEGIDLIGLLMQTIKHHKRNRIFICCPTHSAVEKVKFLLQQGNIQYIEIYNYKSANNLLINICIMPLEKGFFDNQNTFIAYQDLFGVKTESVDHTSQKNSAQKFKNILTELNNLKIDELVVHEDYGIAKFLGITPIDIKGQMHDCAKLEFAQLEYLYTPVENMDAVKRYGSDYAELDKLGGTSFNRRKAILEDKINHIAQVLIETAASRSLIEPDELALDADAYQKFCDAFPYIETEDQQKAIDEIMKDFNSGRLIDRLICGDVGFGKTEVAMRASFMAVYNAPRMQVGIIAPTTILARQHYNNFKERFQGFNVQIAELSRLVGAKQQKIVKEQLANNEIDIIIGTHAVLSDQVQFGDLGLLIIDEEQHFGVAHKEKLKKMREKLHVISLSATPIPRSLQMSLTGIKSLSIIATPPINRLAVKTVVTTYSDAIVRDALMREHNRGGKSFYVMPRIEYLDNVEKALSKIVPELKVGVAHGKMSPTSIDTIMTNFYKGEYDVLVSTTIIESGLDVKSANTIIINKAEMLGLSQLYQLRGRVGRSNVKGYSYLLISEGKKLTSQAYKRLEIMETIDEIGAGFIIASHDMDLRGFGNLVGDQQSGHIKEIGVELYQQMFEEAIAKAKNEKVTKHFNTSINIGLEVYIPESYVQDQNLRLNLYRRISELKSEDEVEKFQDELVDRFGSPPEQLSNLFLTVKIKSICKDLGIKSIDCGEGGFVFRFIEDQEVSNMVMSYMEAHGATTKLKPGNKVVFIRQFKQLSSISATQTKTSNYINPLLKKNIVTEHLMKILLDLKAILSGKNG